MNRMDMLLDKIERRLGTRPLNLPEGLRKNDWAERVIANETLDTFSRYFPNSLLVHLNQHNRRPDGYYVIDQDLPDNIVILGVRDIEWKYFSSDSIAAQEAQGYGLYDFMSGGYGVDDVMLMQGRADMMSAFNNNIYVDYKAPNLVKVSTVTGTNITRGIRSLPVTLLIKHPSNLMTIEPTKMETFEKLAIADIAVYLYGELKYFDIKTVFGDVDFKLSDLESEANKRDSIVEILENNYISAANKNQPLMYCV